MPDVVAIDEIRDIVLEDKPYIDEETELDSAGAGNLVLKTFHDYQTHRSQSQEPRWEKADRLYFGWVKQRYWPGSKNKKRSSLPIQVVFDHLESAYPHVALAMFNQEPYWFEVMPDLGATVEQAQQKQARLSYVLEKQSTDPQRIGQTGLSEVKKSLRSAMHYGNGYGRVGYDPVEKRPFVEYLSVRDVFLPPNCGEWVDSAPGWIERRLMTVDELRELREYPGMNIPDDAKLNSLAKNRVVENDWSLQHRENLREITADPGRQEQNPADQQVEVLIYESKDRVIWVLGRKWVAYNKPNLWGMLTLLGSPYIPVLDSQWGQSFGDLLESEQKLIQSATNAYLDDIALNMDKPRVASHGALNTPQQLLALRPGGLYKAQNPDKDLVPQVSGMVTSEVFVAIGEARMRASERSGVNQMMIQGVPTPSNANRTATGVRGQSQASAMRLYTPIDTFETHFLVPMLLKLDRIMQVVEARGQTSLPGRAPDGRVIDVSPAAMGAQVSFKVAAGSKVRAKEALGPVLPFLLQYLLNPQLTAAMQAIGKSPNITEIDRLVQEAAGTAHRYQFFRDLTPQEMQQRQSAGQPEQQSEEKLKMAELEARMQISREKNQATLEAKQIDQETVMNELAIKVLELLVGEGSEAMKSKLELLKAAAKPKEGSGGGSRK